LLFQYKLSHGGALDLYQDGTSFNDYVLRKSKGNLIFV